VLLLLSIALMSLDHNQQGRLEGLRSVLSVVVYPLQSLINLPVDTAQWLRKSLVTHKVLMEENARLRRENLLLRLRTQKFAALESETRRLRELLEVSTEVGEQALLATVLTAGLEPSSRQIILNKGSQQGVYLGQPIVDAHGIMGQVVHVGPFSSTGMLITDVNHAIPVRINRNGLRAVATGTGVGNTLALSYVPLSADVQKGDLIVSSGMDGHFPPGYPVGQVTRVEIDAGEPFAKISAAPISRLNRAYEALLVWPPYKPMEARQFSSATMVSR
jgi:rod shape-determining protein MreC